MIRIFHPKKHQIESFDYDLITLDNYWIVINTNVSLMFLSNIWKANDNLIFLSSSYNPVSVSLCWNFCLFIYVLAMLCCQMPKNLWVKTLEHSWKLSQGFLRNIQWFLTPECWNAVLNSGHWLGNTSHLWLHHHPLHLQTWKPNCWQFILAAGLVRCLKH